MRIKRVPLSDFSGESNEGELLSKIIKFSGGNSGLTEEFIYNNQPNNMDERVPILSSATLKINLMGHISRFAKPNNKKLKIYNGPCILVTRNGYAGKMTYIHAGEFTINDHAYIITPRKEWKDKIDMRWFAYQYQELFYNLLTSKSDNATFNKEYAERQRIQIPGKLLQDNVAKKLFELDTILKELESIHTQIEAIKNSNIPIY